MKILSIGIIGLGSFGNLVASLASTHTSLEIRGFDINNRTSEHVTTASFRDVAMADIVVLAVPLSAYASVLQDLRPVLPAETLLVDVCSVKMRPEALLQTYLPDHTNVLLTHPLFGPQSAPPTKGRQFVVTKCVGKRAEEVVALCEQQLGLEITRTTSEAHDKTMAQVHALTLFVANGLAKMELPEVPFTTPSYQLLTELVRIQKTHSDDLYQTVERGNPFASAMRQQLIEQFEESDEMLRM